MRWTFLVVWLALVGVALGQGGGAIAADIDVIAVEVERIRMLVGACLFMVSFCGGLLLCRLVVLRSLF